MKILNMCMATKDAKAKSDAKNKGGKDKGGKGGQGGAADNKS